MINFLACQTNDNVKFKHICTMRVFFFFLLCMITSSLFIACEKEENVCKGNVPLPQVPKDTVQKIFSPQWEFLIDDSKDENYFIIDSQYLGIQGWACLATAPYIYVGAVFPKSTFATTFDKEVISEKYPVDLTFDFPIPYATCMEVTKGNEYLQKIKDALRSEEYQSYTFPTRPYIVKLAELKSLSHINSCFPDNQDFGNTLEKIGLQKFDMENINSLFIGKIVFK